MEGAGIGGRASRSSVSPDDRSMTLNILGVELWAGAESWRVERRL